MSTSENQRIELDVNGGKAQAEITHATGAVRGGLVVVQEYWGVNAHIRSVAARFAKEGYEVVTPDLYDGKVAKDSTEAMALIQAMDWTWAVGSIVASAAHARKATGKKVGAVGFCVGGALVLMAAAHDPELAAAVPFYGLPPDPSKLDWSKAKAKILGHYGAKDAHVSLDKAHALETMVNGAGGSMKVESYDADHAFFNDTRKEVYAPEAADLAWKRTIEFFHANVG